MKILFLLLACMPILSIAQSDTVVPRITHDTLYTTSGYKIAEKSKIKVGTGSTPSGDFKFIRINSASFFQYYAANGNRNAANDANALNRSSSGFEYKVVRLEKRGDKRHGYTYYAVINNGAVRYEIDVENAISSGELWVPEEFKKKPAPLVVEVKQQVSIADELAKLKKMLNDSLITKDEYEAAKKKLLQ